MAKVFSDTLTSSGTDIAVLNVVSSGNGNFELQCGYINTSMTVYCEQNIPLHDVEGLSDTEPFQIAVTSNDLSKVVGIFAQSGRIRMRRTPNTEFLRVSSADEGRTSFIESRLSLVAAPTRKDISLPDTKGWHTLRLPPNQVLLKYMQAFKSRDVDQFWIKYASNTRETDEGRLQEQDVCISSGQTREFCAHHPSTQLWRKGPPSSEQVPMDLSDATQVDSWCEALQNVYSDCFSVDVFKTVLKPLSGARTLFSLCSDQPIVMSSELDSDAGGRSGHIRFMIAPAISEEETR